MTQTPNHSNDPAAMLITTSLKGWAFWLGQLSKKFDSLTDDQMLQEITPGKNRPIYLLGHLTAVNDAMMKQLGLGQPQFPELWETFAARPDRSTDLPPLADLREKWKAVSSELDRHFQSLTPTQWLEPHSTVSPEDFTKEPHRNRLAILLSRTSHLAYHLGQLVLIK